MKVSDYIVQFLVNNKITDIFGYPGVGCGHFMDSLSRFKIKTHLVYHEQAAAFAVCAYAQATNNIGLAYTTSGPGGTNLITGIANAYCDSIPTLFIVGDKDLATQKRDRNVRQLTSQEIDITSVAKPITKWSYQITDEKEIAKTLEKALYISKSDRPGPVLLDIPSDIQRSNINESELEHFVLPKSVSYKEYIDIIIEKINNASKPLFLVGNGIKQAKLENIIRNISEQHNIPIVTTLVAIDLFTDSNNRIGFIGLDGDLAANKAVSECDLLVTFGARLNFKQVCNNRKTFASKAKIIRIDCDQNELDYGLHDEIQICADLNYLMPEFYERRSEISSFKEEWINQCLLNKKTLKKRNSLNVDADKIVEKISLQIPPNTPITVDTGSHRRWVMNSFIFKSGQRLYQSAGLVSMGYSLPAAIGLYYACKRPVVCFDGDGGIMMNLQELQMVEREQLPITIIVFNNNCLGDIMEFQKKIFNGNYYITTEETGYKSSDFEGLAKAFHIEYEKIETSNFSNNDLLTSKPKLIEVVIPSNVR